MNLICKIFCCMAFAHLVLVAGCASPKPETAPAKSTAKLDAALVWPKPPDEPRIRYIKSIATPADIGRNPSRWTTVARFITGTPATEREHLLKPFGVAVDESGNVCLTDMDNNTVLFCDLARKEWRRWTGIGKMAFASPVAIARKNGIFYVADSELGKVFGFDEAGHEVVTISEPLQRPSGIAITGDSLVVADSQAHCVLVFDLRGQLRFQFGKRGAGEGEFNFPTHVVTDNHGYLLVTDSLNNRVQIFDGKGGFISQIGSAGDAPGHFGRPKGVAVDSFGHIYVVDAMFDNVQIFDLSGQLLLSWGEGGSSPGQFGVPSGIAIGADNQIYVADSYNRRVQVFKYVGQK